MKTLYAHSGIELSHGGGSHSREKGETHGHGDESHAGHSHAGGSHAGHSHGELPTDFTNAFRIGIILNVAFVLVEATFGFLSDSLSLLADAGHNLSDVLGLVLAWGAAVLARRPATERRTYGMKRGTILAALLNALLLLVAVGGIAWEAAHRFMQTEVVAGGTVIWVAAVGVVINTVTALLFMKGRAHDVNVRGAFLHMAADALVSIGVVIGGIVMMTTGWYLIDPILSMVIVVVITWGTWGLLRESLDLALDAVPRGIDIEGISSYFLKLPGIRDFHHLHVWGMSTTEAALTVHLLKPDPEGDDELLRQITSDLAGKFNIKHVTVQWERSEVCYDDGHSGHD